MMNYNRIEYLLKVLCTIKCNCKSVLISCYPECLKSLNKINVYSPKHYNKDNRLKASKALLNI